MDQSNEVTTDFCAFQLVTIGYFAFSVIYSFIHLCIFKLVLNSHVGLWEPILSSKHRPRQRWETDHMHAWRRSSGCSRTPQSRLWKQTATHLKNYHCGCCGDDK